MFPPRYIVIANSESLRWKAYAPELSAFWASRGVAAEVELVNWREVVARDGCLDDLPAFDRPALVRLEAPGVPGRPGELHLASRASGPVDHRVGGGFRYRGYVQSVAVGARLYPFFRS